MILFVLFTVCIVQAQPVGTKNLGFERGDFIGWKGYTWVYRTDKPSESTSKVEGIVNGRHTIMSDQSAYDANTGGNLKIIPVGYTHSAKLGATQKGGLHQSLSYTMTIDSTNALLVWKFAVVLLNPQSNHEKYEEPRFKITLYNEKGDTIPDCSNYDVYSSDARINGFQTYMPAGSKDPIVWRDWTTVGANLLPYYGQTITIEFMSADCTHKGHYGYGYFVLDCLPLYITVDYCTGDPRAILEAPEGFSKYQWLDTDSATVIGIEQNLVLESPQEGLKYYCQMESETGCEVILSAEVEKYEPIADFSWRMKDCFSNEVEFINNSTTNTGDLSYLWLLEDNTTSTEESFTHKFETSGLHDVGLIVYNPPSGCTDTLFKTIESFSPPLVGFSGDTTYCPDMETELTAYGAFSYEWSTGNTSETLTVGAPGGDFWLLGYSTPEEGCVSDTIRFSIMEEPDWPFILSGDSVLCEGDTNTISAIGADTYTWNTGDSSDFIVVFKEGEYKVSGVNARGCVKELELDVTEVKKPDFDFSVLPTIINRRNNTVLCSAQSGEDVIYNWDLGDGTSSNSPQYSHYYYVGSELISYPVTVTATNVANCYTTKRITVYVEPFVPNVFTPNNDGVNDLFMSGFNLEILDRHGHVLFNGDSGWDGYYKGQLVDPDTYFYHLNYTSAHGEEMLKKGFITVVR